METEIKGKDLTPLLFYSKDLTPLLQQSGEDSN